MTTTRKDSSYLNKKLSTSATDEQSLDVEKKQRKLKHASSNNLKTNLLPAERHSSLHGSEYSGSRKSDIQEDEDLEKRKRGRGHASGSSSSSSSSHRSPLTEEEEAGEAKVLPWHHVQLYNFMGAEADYFLYPKLDVEKRSAKPMSTPLQSRTVYSSVDELWTALRSESSKKLTDVDNKAPQELKATYRAYIREFMKNLDPEDQDETMAMLWGLTQVQDLASFLDDRRERQIEERRRIAQVMFRSSVMNEERTKILLHNSPLPAISDRSGGDCIARFLLPPAEPCTTADRQGTQGTTPISADDADGAADGNSPEPGFDEGLLVSSGRPVRCVFLTEANASSAPGAFSRKRQELEDARLTDMHWTGKQGTSRKASGMKPRIEKNEETCSRERMNSEEKKMTKTVNIKYQPLTLAALMEYATKCKAPGQGSFKFGGRPMWQVQ